MHLTKDKKFNTIHDINKFIKKGKIISQIKLDVPTYSKKNLPNFLKKIPITKPGSRFLR